MSFISNTTVLSNFSRIGGLDLLQSLFDEVFLSVEVYEEIRVGYEEGYEFYSGVDRAMDSEQGWLRLTAMDDVELEAYSRLPPRLHAGEASCLVIAEHRGWLFLSDDRAARNFARARAIELSGTLGCLLIGVERGLWSLERGDDWLREMIAGGFYSPVSDLGSLTESG